jgi:hypothetical protein
MQVHASCARHPDRPAAIACARCGTFVCSGCVVSGDLCSECKSRLFREGVPYSPQEKARATARRCLRVGTWLLRGLLSTGGAGALLLAGSASGALPEVTVWGGWALLGVTALLGAATAWLGSWGYLKSRKGRPGPAVTGVFPGGTAAMMIGVGLAPVLLGLFGLVRQLSS